MRRPLVQCIATILATGLVTMVAACSSSSNTEAGTAGGAQTGAATAGQKEAAAFLAQYTANPTSVGDLSPLPSKPPAGKSVVNLVAPAPVAQRASQALETATGMLGWTYTAIPTGATPASASAAFDAALSRHPDAILFGGYPAAVFAKQIAEAKAAGITVVSNATGDGKVDGVLADVLGRDQMNVYGKLLAAAIVVKSGGNAKVGVFSIQAFPVLGLFVTAFQTWMTKWCPACTTSVVNQQVTDQGTKTPASVVAFLQRNPDVKWLVFGTGDLSQGVPTALATAGLKGINIVGTSPTPANLASLKSGAETAWVGNLVDVTNWRMLDVVVRYVAKADTTSAASTLLPTQLITPENVNTIARDGTGYYIGVADYEAQFKKLWLE